ncbi:hypothetical protein CK203_045692 [Vitis vinifera]|uniref:Reverse transcriptase Ty1/copia-type domain-containing protein n=1 Tax=Vitis vinifera TaxID=29760 RepID=A0A438HQ31_VITVI|nr:hypothetical protein CK203_045692 [Vitis vinifera]
MKIAEVQVPRTIHEALSQSDWRKAVFYEMSALEKTSTWEIVDLLKDKNTVGWEELKEEAYMEIPLGFEGIMTLTRFTKVIKKNDYTQRQSNHTLFVKFSIVGKIAILIVYVNDISLSGDYDEGKVSLKNLLAKEFEIKDWDGLKIVL